MNLKSSAIKVFELLPSLKHRIIRIPMHRQASAPDYDTVLPYLYPSISVNPQY